MIFAFCITDIFHFYIVYIFSLYQFNFLKYFNFAFMFFFIQIRHYSCRLILSITQSGCHSLVVQKFFVIWNKHTELDTVEDEDAILLGTACHRERERR